MRKSPTADLDTLIRAHARLHDDVVLVPFLGRTWQTRGKAYWWRRVGAVVLMLLVFVLVGGMASAFTVGILQDGHSVRRIVLAVAYDLTAVLGVRLGLRKIAEAPLDRRRAPRSFLPSGVIALVLAPSGAGLVLTLLLAMLGRDFPGERKAREITASMATGTSRPHRLR